jgi:hypothetical protein
MASASAYGIAVFFCLSQDLGFKSADFFVLSYQEYNDFSHQSG